MRGKTFLIVMLCILLCVLAGIGGYKGSRYLADSITVKAEQAAEKAGLFKPDLHIEEEITAEDETAANTVMKLEPAMLIYVTDFETGKITRMALAILDTVGERMFILGLDTGISYTMTGTLYRSLANDNVLLPQTVKLKELYGYYGNEGAFSAGKKIVSELLGKDIDYFTAFSVENAPQPLNGGEWTSYELSKLYGSGEDVFSDMRKNEAESYAALAEKLEDSDIREEEAPVIRRNESSFLDIVGTWELIYAKEET